jgi:hypothetical protein
MRSLFDRCFLMEEVQGEDFIFLQMSQYLTVSEADSAYRGAETSGPED